MGLKIGKVQEEIKMKVIKKPEKLRENVRISESIFEDQKIFENIDKIEHKHDDDDEMS